jgi:hypothetical protein
MKQVGIRTIGHIFDFIKSILGTKSSIAVEMGVTVSLLSKQTNRKA